MNKDSEKYFTPQEVADALKVEARTVHTWLRDGQMKGVKIGRLWRIPQSEIDKASGVGSAPAESVSRVPFEKAYNMKNYEETCKTFSIDVPEYFNFGYDVIDKWAETDRNKLAMIWTNQQGLEKKYSFRDLKNLSNQVANILLK